MNSPLNFPVNALTEKWLKTTVDRKHRHAPVEMPGLSCKNGCLVWVVDVHLPSGSLRVAHIPKVGQNVQPGFHQTVAHFPLLEEDFMYVFAKAGLE